MQTYRVGSWQHGIWGFRLGRVYIALKAPWNRPLYGERNRLIGRALPLGGGWRIRYMRDDK